MGIEGGGRSSEYPEMPRRTSEGGFESYERRRLEERAGQPERWISEIISPEKLKRIREHPAYEGHTTEWIIMEALLAKLVEQGPEMDLATRAQLRNLVSTFRALMIPNLNSTEQDFMRDLARSTTVNWTSLRIEVTPDTVEDIRWIWRTFGLQVPHGAGRGILEAPAAIPQLRRPRSIE